jgi:hypothetical protein
VIRSLLRVEADESDLDVTIQLTCTETGSTGDRVVGERSWHRRFARDFG